MDTLLFPAVPLGSILDLRVVNGLPLHIGRDIGSPAFKRYDVIDDVSFPAPGIPGLFHEFFPYRGTPQDLSVGSSGRDR